MPHIARSYRRDTGQAVQLTRVSSVRSLDNALTSVCTGYDFLLIAVA